MNDDMTAASTPLAARSREVILAGQAPGGAYLASPGSPIYRFGWLRDGAYSALAMDTVGEHASAAAFHGWAARTVLNHRRLFEDGARRAHDEDIDPAHMPPARFTLQGELEPAGEGEELWPNFQLDCYGTWLWTLGEHARHGGELTATQHDAAATVTDYLLAAGTEPCFDCWEEHPGHRHTSTLAAVAAGLRTAATLLDHTAAGQRALALRDLLAREHTLAGAYVRFPGDTRVDASLLWLAVPYQVIPLTDPVMAATVERVRAELTGPGGGLRRYLGDTFYGGSEWILTTAFLALADAQAGDLERARRGLAWIEAQANRNLDLPEHVPHHVQSTHMLAYWQQRWGHPTTPLLWSHAMHLLLLCALDHSHPA